MFSFPATFWSSSAATSYIVSIQQFVITIPTSATTNTATISSVNTANSVIFYDGFNTTDSSSTYRLIFPRANLTNSTTVTVTRDTLSATNTVTVRGTVVEFTSAAISSVQQGTITIASGATSGTATISAVTTARSVVFYLGVSGSTTSSTPANFFSRLDLTNTTTVTANRGQTSTVVLTVGYCVVEFASGVTNSVQQRAITRADTNLTFSDTITSVVQANTLIIYNGVMGTSSTLIGYLYNLQLTAATTVVLTRTNTNSTSRTLNYTALEFASGVINTIQRGTLAVNSVTSADATITAVNTAKSVCNMPGFNSTVQNPDQTYCTVKLLDSTTVRAEKNTAGTSTATPGYEVVEFV